MGQELFYCRSLEREEKHDDHTGKCKDIEVPLHVAKIHAIVTRRAADGSDIFACIALLPATDPVSFLGEIGRSGGSVAKERSGESAGPLEESVCRGGELW